jgi:hypothetical protein
MGGKGEKSERQFLPAIRLAAASYALAGSLGKAQELTQRLREADPSLTISGLKQLNPFRRPIDFARWTDGLREAGLPD